MAEETQSVDDLATSVNEASFISVVKVSDDSFDEEDSNGGKTTSEREAKDLLLESQAAEEAGNNPNKSGDLQPHSASLTVSQFELMLSELKTRHIAEKRMLQCDLSLCKKVIHLMAKNIRLQARELRRKEVYVQQYRKLVKENQVLVRENLEYKERARVSEHKKCKLTTLILDYEHESIFRRLESEYLFEQLAKENDNLKRLMLINHDFTSSIEERLKELEREEQARAYE